MPFPTPTSTPTYPLCLGSGAWDQHGALGYTLQSPGMVWRPAPGSWCLLIPSPFWKVGKGSQASEEMGTGEVRRGRLGLKAPHPYGPGTFFFFFFGSFLVRLLDSGLENTQPPRSISLRKEKHGTMGFGAVCFVIQVTPKISPSPKAMMLVTTMTKS